MGLGGDEVEGGECSSIGPYGLWGAPSGDSWWGVGPHLGPEIQGRFPGPRTQCPAQQRIVDSWPEIVRRQGIYVLLPLRVQGS